jgi:hypothetical protein
VFTWLLAGGVLMAIAAGVVWCWTDMSRDAAWGRTRWWRAALLAGVVAVPTVPTTSMPLRVERVLYEGPDLLSPEPVRSVEIRDSWIVPGVVRVKGIRSVQGETLLDERSRVEVGLPWALLLVAMGWWVARRGPTGAMAVAVAALGLGACVGPEPSPASVEERRIIELMEIRRSGDAAGIESLFHPTAVYEDLTSGARYRDLPEIAEFMEGFHSPDGSVFLEVIAYHSGDGMAAAEWVLDGTRLSPSLTSPDSVFLSWFRVDGVTLIELEDGLIVRAADYGDPTSLVLAEGGIVVLPGGDTLRALPETVTRPPPRR